MPSALPAGWLDCGITRTQTLSLDFTVKPFGGIIPGTATGISAWETLEIEGWRVGSNGTGPGPSPCDADTLGGQFGTLGSFTAYVNQAGAPFASRTDLDTVAGACSPAYHTTRTCTKTAGPYRLGVTYEVDTAAGTRNLRYALFGDAATRVVTVLAGVTIADSFPYAVPTNCGSGTTLSFSALANSFSPVSEAAEYTTKITNAKADGLAVSLAQVGSQGAWEITSSNVAQYKLRQSFGLFPDAIAHSFGPPYRYSYDVLASWADGANTSATVKLNALSSTGLVIQANTDTSGGVGSPSVANTSWDWGAGIGNQPDGRIQAKLDSGWASMQNPSLSGTDLLIPTSQMKPKRPGNAPESWSPLEITIASPVSVLLSTNAWTPTGAVAVAGSVFTVTAPGASVARNLNSSWRNWNAPADPLYHADDLFTTTKHDYYGDLNQDVWGWGLYAYLDINLTTPASSTLTITVNCATASATPYTFSRSYTKTFPNGASTQRIDLLFPDTAAECPCYFERVDSISISGFGNGIYTLTSLQLAAAEQAYVKMANTGTVGTRPWPGLQIVQDGAGECILWGPNPLHGAGPALEKDDEDGIFTTDTGTSYPGGCVRMDGTLAALATELSRMEGVTATDNAVAMNTDLLDTFGNAIGFTNGVATAAVPQANWLHNNLPHTRVSQNSLATFPASIPADTYQIVPMTGNAFNLVFRRTLGMVVEALVTTPELARLSAGAQVALQIAGHNSPTPTLTPASDPVVMVATTDASGYAWAWVRTGTYAGYSHYTVYFTGVS